ncbi:hypothetical protein TNCV_4023501 [Trichonephila clavipes]|nr:hypothetical protein TNCV_4023501 [Trichonephila clavipes]
MTTSNIGGDEIYQQTSARLIHPSWSAHSSQKGNIKANLKKKKKHNPSNLPFLFLFWLKTNRDRKGNAFFSCHKIAANGCLVPSKLKRHLGCNNFDLVYKGKGSSHGPLDLFRQRH